MNLTLKISGILKSLGYNPFTLNDTFHKSSINYINASLLNEKNSPVIYELVSESNMKIKIWSPIFNRVIIATQWDEEYFKFSENLYINDDGFLVHSDLASLDLISSFNDLNCFNRPSITGIDERIDLGDLFFCVSENGILFSFYEHPSHKVINESGLSKQLRIFDGSIDFKIQASTIGEYGNALKVKSVHVFPKRDFWS